MRRGNAKDKASCKRSGQPLAGHGSPSFELGTESGLNTSGHMDDCELPSTPIDGELREIEGKLHKKLFGGRHFAD